MAATSPATCRRNATLLFVAVGGLVLAVADAASGQTLFVQDFSNFNVAEPPEGQLVSFGAVEMGHVNFLDDSATGRSFFAAAQAFTAELLTFSFDIVAPATRPEGSSYEVVLRTGIGTALNSLQNADQIAEAIVYRDGNRGAYLNNGNETIFMVLNNKETPQTFPSPIDGVDVTLPGFNYIPYVRDNATDAFGQIKGISAFQDRNGAEAGFGGFTRFAIGTSSSGHQGAFALDNVLVEQGITFERSGLDVGAPGDVDDDGDVDLDDFALIQNHFQQTVTLRTEGDLNGDGFVDFLDFRQWKTNFTPSPGVAAGAPVPEPTSLAIAAVAPCALHAAHRRLRLN